MTHISGHHHLHLHPSVLSIIKELAEEYPIPALRKPCGKLIALEGRRMLPPWQRRVEVFTLRRMAGWGRLRSRAFPGVDRVEALCVERPATEYALIERLASIGDGITEFVCHPGSLLPRYDGIGEAAVVTSAVVRSAFEEHGIDLCSYRAVGDNFYPGRHPHSFETATPATPDFDL